MVTNEKWSLLDLDDVSVNSLNREKKITKSSVKAFGYAAVI